MFMFDISMPGMEPIEAPLAAFFASLRASCAENPIHTATEPRTTTSMPSKRENAAQ
jgi:hypothetical protein